MMIDVIIPAYNAHHTIERTIMSLAYQTKAKDVVISIVNDGTKEGYEYLDYYKDYFAKINYFNLPENHGVGYCRQYAIDRTDCPYFYFIDSDDYMNSCYVFERLFDIIKNDEYDLVQCNVILENGNNEVIHYEYPQVYYGRDYEGNKLYLHGKLFRRKFIEENNIKVPPYRSNEDIAYNAVVYSLIDPKRLFIYKEFVASTIVNMQSITRSTKSTRKWEPDNVIEFMDAYNAHYDAFLQVKDKNSFNNKSWFFERYDSAYFRITGMISSDYNNKNKTKKEKIELFKYIMKLFHENIIKEIIKEKSIEEIINHDKTFNKGVSILGRVSIDGFNHIYNFCEKLVFDKEKFDLLCNKYINNSGYKEIKIIEGVKFND